MSVVQDNFRDGQAVTPHDVNPLPKSAIALWVGGTGTVTVITEAGNSLLFTGVPAGATLPIRCSAVKATGTTATNIVALLP